MKTKRHEETFGLIKECFLGVHSLEAKENRQQIEEESGWLGKVRLHLFEKPFISYIYLLGGLIVLYGLNEILAKIFGNFINRGTFSLFLLILYIAISIFLRRITPSFDRDYDDRWSIFLKIIEMKLLEDKPGIFQIKKIPYIKNRVQKAVNYYRRNGAYMKFFVELMWGGIFIGCLPDTKFQQVLLEFPNICKIWAINPFGVIALVSILLIGPIYHFRYRIPRVWMEEVITQIELNDIK